ncbi:MAG: patatin-like phospholipase family protein, partial [Pseudomonadales bacterium]
MSHLSPEFNAEVFPAELEEIASRREQLGLPTASLGKTLSTDNGLVGLSLSGGGIRSAVFSLGVIQGLAKYGLLKRVDYLSTVSGGGYIGSCISSLLNDPENRPENEKFPLRLSGGTSETAALTHLRNSSNYLSPGGLLEKLRIPNVLLRGIVLNLLVFLPGIMAAVVVTGAVFEFIPRWDYLAHFVLWLILGFAVLAVTFSIAVKTFRRHFGWHRRNLFELVLT